MKIFLDFDETLFDTQRFKKDLWDIFGRIGFSIGEIKKSYEIFVGAGNNTGFVNSPEAHLQFMQKQQAGKGDTGNRKLENFLSQDMSQYLYSDSINFFAGFRREDLAILSFGDDSFQRQKILKSGIESLVGGVFITQVEKSGVIDQLCKENIQDVYFLDNTPVVVDEVKQSLPWVKTILVSRPEGRYHDAKTKWYDFEVQNLDEARRIINNGVSK